MRWVPVLGCMVMVGGCAILHPPKPFADEVAISPPIAKLEQGQRFQVLFLNTHQPRATVPGTPLRSGEVVMTSPRGTAQVKFHNQTITRLAPQSRITLRSGQSFELERGSLLVSSPDFIQINTKWGRLGFKNAALYVRSSPYLSRILVLKGKVQNFILDSDVKVGLSPGEELFITPLGIPWKVQKLDQSSQKRWLQTLKKEFQFTDRLPADVIFLERWQPPEPVVKAKPKTKQQVEPPSYTYQEPIYTPPPSYDYYEEPYYAPAPVARPAPTPPPPPVVRAAPPPSPAPVVAEPPPPPPPTEEAVPVEVPVATETIPVEPPPDENPE